MRQSQYDAVCNSGIPDHAELQRLAGIPHPVLVANGDGDPVLWQHHAEFASDVTEFLS